MRLSILIPMRNASSHILECIKSITNQGILKDTYEIIILDDGSDDNSVAVVKHYIQNIKHRNNISLIEQSNQGVYKARNTLLLSAKGRYIYFLDADDIVVPNTLKVLLDYADKENLDMLGFKTEEIQKFNFDSLDSIVINMNDFYLTTGIDYIAENRNLRHEIWWYVFRRSYFESLGLLFDTHEYHADVVFTLKLLINCRRFGFCKKKLHNYVQTPNSIMRNQRHDRKLKRVKNMSIMIGNYSQLINNVEVRNTTKKSQVLNNLKFRRDLFAFFNLLKMVKMGLSFKEIKSEINNLKNYKVYPIRQFIGEEYQTLKYKTMIFFVNRPMFLFIFSLIVKAISIKQKK